VGFLSDMARSWRKSGRLQELQKRVSPPNQSIEDMVAKMLQGGGDALASQRRALEEYLDLCEEDPNVQQVMRLEGVGRDALKQLHARLLMGGLGGWVKGHNMALSTLAYAEPLQFALRSPKLGMRWEEVILHLMDYWEERLPHGTLFASLGNGLARSPQSGSSPAAPPPPVAPQPPVSSPPPAPRMPAPRGATPPIGRQRSTGGNVTVEDRHCPHCKNTRRIAVKHSGDICMCCWKYV
jgi:hypothetical protein